MSHGKHINESCRKCQLLVDVQRVWMKKVCGTCGFRSTVIWSDLSPKETYVSPKETYVWLWYAAHVNEEGMRHLWISEEVTIYVSLLHICVTSAYMCHFCGYVSLQNWCVTEVTHIHDNEKLTFATWLIYLFTMTHSYVCHVMCHRSDTSTEVTHICRSDTYLQKWHIYGLVGLARGPPGRTK